MAQFTTKHNMISKVRNPQQWHEIGSITASPKKAVTWTAEQQTSFVATRYQLICSYLSVADFHAAKQYVYQVTTFLMFRWMPCKICFCCLDSYPLMLYCMPNVYIVAFKWLQKHAGNFWHGEKEIQMTVIRRLFPTITFTFISQGAYQQWVEMSFIAAHVYMPLGKRLR